MLFAYNTRSGIISIGVIFWGGIIVNNIRCLGVSFQIQPIEAIRQN